MIPPPGYSPKANLSDSQAGSGMIPPPDNLSQRLMPRSLIDGNVTACFVYLIRSLKTEKFYAGWTTDLNRRLQEHNDGKSYYTSRSKPWELIGYETFSDSNEAKIRERKLKRNPRMSYLFKKRLLNKFLLDKQVVG